MSTPHPQPPGAAELAKGYSRWFRLVEVASIVSFWLLMALLGRKLWPAAEALPWVLASALGAGFLLADFVSGVVHWMADTWGSVNMPVIGQTLLRPFREHHVDPKAMTRHDYVETNGANCLISLPVAVGALLIPTGAAGWGAVGVFGAASIGSMIFWVMLTNQIHKWSHFEPHELPAPVRWAQRAHLVLPPGHHQRHHTAPFDTYYCITTGWLNWPLARLGFFRLLERAVTATTGAIPRHEDLGLVAALAAAPAAPSPQMQVDLPRP